MWRSPLTRPRVPRGRPLSASAASGGGKGPFVASAMCKCHRSVLRIKQDAVIGVPVSPASGSNTVPNHTIKAFDAGLLDLRRKVAEMGGLVERQSAQAIDALAKANMMLAHRVIALDDAIDEMQRDVEMSAIE